MGAESNEISDMYHSHFDCGTVYSPASNYDRDVQFFECLSGDSDDE